MDTELLSAAVTALSQKDQDEINRIDTELHAHFFAALRGGEELRNKFIAALLRVTDHREVRALGREADAAAKALTTWRHLVQLIQGVRAGVDPVERARVVLSNREGAERLVDEVRAAGPKGIRFADLVERLGEGQKKSNVSRLAGELEDLGVIERERVGRDSVYFLGLVGSALADAAETVEAVQAPLSGGLRNMKQYLCAVSG